MQDIKKAVQAPAEEMPALDDFDVAEPLEPPVSAQRYPDRAAPLFVKIDKYKELIDLIHEMKVFNSSLKEMFVVMNEADNVKNDALKIMRATVGRLDRTLAAIDAELVMPEGVDLEESYTESEVKYIESSLSDLQRQLAVLRKDIQEMKE